MNEILEGEIYVGIFGERVKAFLKPFSTDPDLLVGEFLGIRQLLKELPAYKEQYTEDGYLGTYNALLLQKSKVEATLRASEAEKDDLARREMKKGIINNTLGI